METKEKFEDWIKQQSDCKFIHSYQIIAYSPDEKLGFFIKQAINDGRGSVKYIIAGAISDYGRLPRHNSTIYDAEISINYNTNHAILRENVVDPQHRGQGIGSLGLTYIKDFCESQNCAIITGFKHPVPNTQEEMDKLTRFYTKNEFEQCPNNKVQYCFCLAD